MFQSRWKIKRIIFGSVLIPSPSFFNSGQDRMIHPSPRIAFSVCSSHGPYVAFYTLANAQSQPSNVQEHRVRTHSVLACQIF